MLREIRDEVNMMQSVDIKMSSSVDDDDSQLDARVAQDQQNLDLSTIIKARFLFVAPQSHLVDTSHFSETGNYVKLLKFLKRSSLVDASLRVLCIHYVNFTGEKHLCGKIVYNQLARLLMSSLAMIQHSLKPHEVSIKHIKIAK